MLGWINGWMDQWMGAEADLGGHGGDESPPCPPKSASAPIH